MDILIKTTDDFIHWTNNYGRRFDFIEDKREKRSFRTNGPDNCELTRFLDVTFCIPESSKQVVFLDIQENPLRAFSLVRSGVPYEQELVYQPQELGDNDWQDLCSTFYSV